MGQTWDGNLSLVTSRPGVTVRCVKSPGARFHDFWDRHMRMQAFLFVPTVRGLYRIRANVAGADAPLEYFRSGVLLNDEKGRPLLNPKVFVGLGHTEPFFPFDFFDFVS